MGRVGGRSKRAGIYVYRQLIQQLPRWCSGKEPTCQCRRHKRRGFDPWVRKIPWRRKWQPAPVFLPGEPHGQRSLVGYSPWGTESDVTEHQQPIADSLCCMVETNTTLESNYIPILKKTIWRKRRLWKTGIYLNILEYKISTKYPVISDLQFLIAWLNSYHGPVASTGSMCFYLNLGLGKESNIGLHPKVFYFLWWTYS